MIEANPGATGVLQRALPVDRSNEPPEPMAVDCGCFTEERHGLRPQDADAVKRTAAEIREHEPGHVGRRADQTRGGSGVDVHPPEPEQPTARLADQRAGIQQQGKERRVHVHEGQGAGRLVLGHVRCIHEAVCDIPSGRRMCSET